MVIPSALSAARQVEEMLLGTVASNGYSEAAIFAIKLALEEGLNNAIKHGNRYDSAKTVEVVYDIDCHQAMFSIKDQGPGFDLDAVPDPTADENLERPSGRGIMLMRAYMDEVHYNETGNQITMIKRKG